ncbi:hypothetical protein V474_17605 [Novosphingobium barchaimii LL02]|uniref:Uncharacterized protein n=1 Tax=Novosphingobium barchaimii LL02 TaxID=1114963 RepID=A0A0J7XWC4_9SPHN|nr:hypothetical protein V474_17605 [Novosphingobium barchaimii LL02]
MSGQSVYDRGWDETVVRALLPERRLRPEAVILAVPSPSGRERMADCGSGGFEKAIAIAPVSLLPSFLKKDREMGIS